MPSKTVLVIDDDEMIREMMAMVLRSASFEVLLAGSGEEGLRLARERLPDLTFCDVNMPEKGGRSVLEGFRSDPDLVSRPIVIITGNPEELPQRAAMNLGADDYLAKPFSAGDVLACVESRLKRAEVHWRVESQVLTELRRSLHSNLPHEFFTPLAGIIGLSDIMASDAERLSPHEVSDLARDIKRSGERLHRTLRNYLMVFELDSEEVEDDSADRIEPLPDGEAAELIEKRARNAAESHGRSSDLNFDLQPCSPRIERAPLGTIVEELTDNACKFSRKGTPINIALRTEGDGVILEIADRGRGMTDDQKDRVGMFIQFDRKGFEQQGLGLGLGLIARLLRKTRGSIDFETAPGEGTRVKIRLPAGSR